MDLKNLAKDLLIRILGAALAVSLIAGLALFGNSDLPGSSFFDSQGGLLVGTILLMEFFFFTGIALLYIFGE